MPVKPLPANPNLDHLKHQAKDLLKQHARKELSSAQRLREFHPKFRSATDQEIFARPLSLSDAQLSIARERGFTSWTRLKRHIEKPTLVDRLTLLHHERIEDPTFRHAVDLIDTGNVAALRSHLAQNPNLIHRHILLEGANYFRNPSLLEFIAENPIRHGVMPVNIVDVTKAILEAGPEPAARNETLMLVATGSIPRECKVQIPLIETLCAYGADPNCALDPAALHGELESVHALIRLGAKMDLPILAALGKADDFLKHLPSSDPDKRHFALALAAQYGHVEIVRSLLDAGEDPDRYNPPGGHAHSTPLHQAALAGHTDVVKLLVERGARLDIKDVLWQGTPADWARYAKRPEIESDLREQQKVAQRE
jgi:hypothetical protein